jgi:hypothetical protein
MSQTPADSRGQNEASPSATRFTRRWTRRAPRLFAGSIRNVPRQVTVTLAALAALATTTERCRD